MRLRLAMIAIVFLVLGGIFVLAHERARAEHLRVALFDAALPLVAVGGLRALAGLIHRTRLAELWF